MFTYMTRTYKWPHLADEIPARQKFLRSSWSSDRTARLWVTSPYWTNCPAGILPLRFLIRSQAAAATFAPQLTICREGLELVVGRDGCGCKGVGVGGGEYADHRWEHAVNTATTRYNDTLALGPIVETLIYMDMKAIAYILLTWRCITLAWQYSRQWHSKDVG